MLVTINQRVTAKIEGDYWVFLICVRVNRRDFTKKYFTKKYATKTTPQILRHKYYKVLSFVPKRAMTRAMNCMVSELRRNLELGMRHVEMWNGSPTIMVYYWMAYY